MANDKQRWRRRKMQRDVVMQRRIIARILLQPTNELRISRVRSSHSLPPLLPRVEFESWQKKNLTKQKMIVEVLIKVGLSKPSSGPRYVVGCRSKVDKEKLTFRKLEWFLSMTNTLRSCEHLPREIRELSESIEPTFDEPLSFSLEWGLSLQRVSLLYGPPGTGETLLA
ncbi:hypothetical protein NC652_004953 [Populus alba x Populus x berolinensis]|nr:hypothetical protein NC652_004953 [Populus alba x Populus x berolinensis]